MIAQYKNYTISDGKGGRVHLNPELTIGEDVADAGGLAQAFLAWKNSWKKQREEGQFNTNAKLPGLDYTQEQLFFIAYGLSWSRNIRDQEAIRRLRTVSLSEGSRFFSVRSHRFFSIFFSLFLPHRSTGSSFSNFLQSHWSSGEQCRLH